MSGKWLELLKQIAPAVTRVAVLRDPTIASGIGQFAAVQLFHSRRPSPRYILALTIGSGHRSAMPR